MNLKSLIPWRKEKNEVARRNGEGDPFTALQRRMNGLFDEFFGRPTELWDGYGDSFAPRVDLNETDKEVRITAELPGLDEKDIEVTLTGNMLTIKGEKKEEQEEEKGESWHSERSYGYFERTVQVPEEIDSDKVEAKFKKGVLKLTLPKKPEAQSKRRKIELIAD
jgi:HSP20 family protein